jgi:thiosulfate/3-mercaptopyruvate sulfurtransferase
MLRWLGHRAVAVLDGGLAAWQAAGGALDSTLPTPRPHRPTRSASRSCRSSTPSRWRRGSVACGSSTPARPSAFRGEVEPLDAQAGHIPGALNRYYKDNLEPDGRFKPAPALRADFERLGVLAGDTEVVHQCGSGVTACHNLLAMEVAGLGTTTLYPGSWSEWSADPARPVAKG